MSNFRISRRKVLISSLTLGLSSIPIRTFAQSKLAPLNSNSCITDVPGIKVGNFTDDRSATGCTVILTLEGAVAGVDVRGAAPGTRETDLLDPKNLVQEVHAILLSGGSAFGLDAATGVMKFLEERDVGYDVGVAKVPIVPAAILFDLNVGDAKIRPDAMAGYQACKNASDKLVKEGNVGAGAGATVGKLFGINRAMKGGIGTASIKLPTGITVGAIVAVNAVGDIFDPSNGKLLAGVRSPDGKKLLGAMQAIADGEELPPLLGGMNTTIGVVAIDVKLDKAQCQKIAQMAHDGLARTINPVHTMYDGDTIFALSTGESAANVNLTLLGAASAEVMAQAVIRAILSAESIRGLPSSKDLVSIVR